MRHRMRSAEYKQDAPRVIIPETQSSPPAYTENPLWSPKYVFEVTAREQEPMCLLDTTLSFTYGTSATDRTPRHDTVREMMGTLVAELEGNDSQAAHEEDGGGLRTVTFAGGRAIDIGDLNTRNLNEVWSQIKWEGGTYVMPGWNLLKRTYFDEFGSRRPEDMPALMAIVITDGEASDLKEFETALATDTNSFVVVVVMGFGNEHANVMRSFNDVSAANSRVKVIDFGGGVDPANVAGVLKRMVQPKC